MFSVNVLAAGEQSVKTFVLPELLKKVEKKYSSAKTLKARFNQVNESAVTKIVQPSSGLIWLKRPNKFLWETQKPDPNLLVSDGKMFWFYTPPFDEGEHGQVIKRRTSEVQSQLASILLAGSFSKVKDVEIQIKSQFEFVLLPKTGTAGTVRKASVLIDSKRELISKVLLEHESGNQSEISLSDIKLGTEIEDVFFEFKVPPGTVVLKE